jgi:hypothetical protein
MPGNRWVGRWTLVLCLMLATQGAAQTGNSEPASAAVASRTASKPVIDGVDPAELEHPLTPLLKYARDAKHYVDRTVHSYSCRLTKRERIDDELSGYQYANLLVRDEVRSDDMVSTPFAAYVEFLAPARLVGRKVLYVSGENEGKMLVRRGGKRLSYVVVKLDPHGPSARQESRVPITEASFSHIIGGLIAFLERHIEADPHGANTVVQHSSSARINGRACSVIRVVHPRKDQGLGFYIGTVYIDQALHVPVRIEAYGWPDDPENSPPLLGEYTYTDLKLNVGLSQQQFQPGAVRGR